MRGQAVYDPDEEVYVRITPADAGTRVQDLGSYVQPRDHPRGCGDKLQPAGHSDLAAGSPPRMRGQVSENSAYDPIHRITPADAGTSHDDGVHQPHVQDHPRGCGDKDVLHLRGHLLVGSPPRMRGQVAYDATDLVEDGITPADAGTRIPPLARPSNGQDHPRGCGDKCERPQKPPELQGSPPRMRGQAFLPRFS